MTVEVNKFNDPEDLSFSDTTPVIETQTVLDIGGACVSGVVEIKK